MKNKPLSLLVIVFISSVVCASTTLAISEQSFSEKVKEKTSTLSESFTEKVTNLNQSIRNIPSKIEEQINKFIKIFKIFLILVVIFFLIWIVGWIRQNLGFDEKTRELKKIRALLQEIVNKDKSDINDQ